VEGARHYHARRDFAEIRFLIATTRAERLKNVAFGPLPRAKKKLKKYS
jgi:hypothetical protein